MFDNYVIQNVCSFVNHKNENSHNNYYVIMIYYDLMKQKNGMTRKSSRPCKMI
jgi:hypothetical protein